MKSASKFIKHALVYSSSLYISQIISLIVGFFTARILGPEILGMWASIAVILTFTAQSDFGIINGMNKTFPFLKGKKEFEEASKTKDIAFTYMLISATVVMLLIIASSFLMTGKYKQILTIGMLVIGVLAFCQQLILFYNAFLRVNDNFELLSKSKVVFSLCSLLIIPFVFKWGIYGLFWASILANCILLGYLIFRSMHRFKIVIEIDRIKSLIKVGLPITAIGLAYVGFTTADRIMIINFLPVVDMGYYRIATILMSLVTIIPATIGFIMYPSLLEKFGETGNISSIRPRVEKPTFVMITALLSTIGFLFLIIPFMIENFLPEYIPGILPARILLLSIFFLGIISVHGTFLVAIDKQQSILRIQILSIALNVLLSYIFIKQGLGLSGIALGTGITYFIYGNLLLWHSYSYFLDRNNKKQLGILFFLNFPFFISLVALLVLDKSLLYNKNHIVDFFNTLRCVVIYQIALIALMLCLDKKYKALKEVFENLTLAFHSKAAR